MAPTSWPPSLTTLQVKSRGKGSLSCLLFQGRLLSHWCGFVWLSDNVLALIRCASLFTARRKSAGEWCVWGENAAAHTDVWRAKKWQTPRHLIPPSIRATPQTAQWFVNDAAFRLLLHTVRRKYRRHQEGHRFKSRVEKSNTIEIFHVSKFRAAFNRVILLCHFIYFQYTWCNNSDRDCPFCN